MGKMRNTKKRRSDISDIVRNIRIDSIFLVNSSCRRSEGDPRSQSPLRISVDYDAKLSSKPGRAFSVDASLALSMFGGEDASLLDVQATFRICYSMKEGGGPEKPSKSKLDEFARKNGAFNAWPYWREYIHNTLARMEIPSIVIPPYHYGRGPGKIEGTVTRRKGC